MQDIINTWKEGRGVLQNESIEQLISKAKGKKRSVLTAHFITVAVLGTTFILIAFFCYYQKTFSTALSYRGLYIMMGCLLLRIGIEVLSIVKSKAIQFTESTEKATREALHFYAFRRKVHGPVTIIIFGLYIVGFYLLSPELSNYLAFESMMLLHISFIIGALILVWIITNGIRKETADLHHIKQISNDVHSAESGGPHS